MLRRSSALLFALTVDLTAHELSVWHADCVDCSTERIDELHINKL